MSQYYLEMRLADYISSKLFALGCEHVFMVTGGAAMHLNDAFSKNGLMKIHCLHHEQSCSMAAESFGRITGKPAIVNVTAGPGGINALNGVYGAYVDSVPMIIISGQAKRETLVVNSAQPNLRQLGDQEVDIIRMAGGICKYAKIIQDPLTIKYELEQSYLIAASGRPGPVWLDIPIDVQSSSLPEEYDISLNDNSNTELTSELVKQPIASDQDIFSIANKLLNSRRPVFYVGNGIRISNSLEEFYDFLEKWPLATVTGWNSNDLLWDEHPCYCGRPGTVGNRAGNFAVQFSDCVIAIGCRLNIRQVSYNWNSFAKNAWKCHLDIDRDELDKHTLNTDLKVHACIQDFFPRLSECLERIISNSNKFMPMPNWQSWRSWLHLALDKYPVYSTTMDDNKFAVNPYKLIHELTSQLNKGDHIVCADGTACVVGFQAAVIKPEQRIFHNSGCASMGYELPAAIGAYFATEKQVICIAGDGSIMMNLQELAIIGGMSLPIKIFLLNNEGYHSIRQTQNNYFAGNQIGCGSDSGLVFPDFAKLSMSFGICYSHTVNDAAIQKDLKETLRKPGPSLHEFQIDLNQQFEPKLSSKKLNDGSMVSSELEDMFPFLGTDVMNKLRTEAFNL